MVLLINIYTYQDREYIIRTMNTKHAQLVTKPYTYRYSCSRLHTRLDSVALSTFVIKMLRQCYPALGNKLDLNTAWRPYEVALKVGEMIT